MYIFVNVNIRGFELFGKKDVDFVNINIMDLFTSRIIDTVNLYIKISLVIYFSGVFWIREFSIFDIAHKSFTRVELYFLIDVLNRVADKTFKFFNLFVKRKVLIKYFIT